jgi:hypothetical protein
MYILATIHKKDQTIERIVGDLEMLMGHNISMKLASASVTAVEFEKLTKAELKERGITHAGKQ